MKKLPDKQSDLLRLAVKDARILAKNKKYILSMKTWHTPIEFGPQKGKCAVCMAGAVMANTLKMPPTKKSTAGEFTIGEEIIGFDICDKLYTINHMREGTVKYTGTDQDRIDAVKKVRDLISSNYSNILDRAPWKIYEKAASILESVGL